MSSCSRPRAGSRARRKQAHRRSRTTFSRRLQKSRKMTTSRTSRKARVKPTRRPRDLPVQTSTRDVASPRRPSAGWPRRGRKEPNQPSWKRSMPQSRWLPARRLPRLSKSYPPSSNRRRLRPSRLDPLASHLLLFQEKPLPCLRRTRLQPRPGHHHCRQQRPRRRSRCDHLGAPPRPRSARRQRRSSHRRLRHFASGSRPDRLVQSKPPAPRVDHHPPPTSSPPRLPSPIQKRLVFNPRSKSSLQSHLFPQGDRLHLHRPEPRSRHPLVHLRRRQTRRRSLLGPSVAPDLSPSPRTSTSQCSRTLRLASATPSSHRSSRTDQTTRPRRQLLVDTGALHLRPRRNQTGRSQHH